jgi:hypothetical protein
VSTDITSKLEIVSSHERKLHEQLPVQDKVATRELGALAAIGRQVNSHR